MALCNKIDVLSFTNPSKAPKFSQQRLILKRKKPDLIIVLPHFRNLKKNVD